MNTINEDQMNNQELNDFFAKMLNFLINKTSSPNVKFSKITN